MYPACHERSILEECLKMCTFNVERGEMNDATERGSGGGVIYSSQNVSHFKINMYKNKLT